MGGGVHRAEVPLRTLRCWLHEISVDEAEDEVAKQHDPPAANGRPAAEGAPKQPPAKSAKGTIAALFARAAKRQKQDDGAVDLT